MIFEERNKVLSRPLITSRLAYTGPSIQSENLSRKIIHQSIHSISQEIDSELDEDKNCRNYPFENFSSYKDCDDEFVQQEIKKFDLIPFWATDHFGAATNLRLTRTTNVVRNAGCAHSRYTLNFMNE